MVEPHLRADAPGPAVAWAGIGWKDEHAAALLHGEARVDFVEVHAENVMGAGGPRQRLLERLRAECPLSVHGVGLSLGGADPLDPRHLDRFVALVDRLQPRWVSEHLAWSRHGRTCFADLLPPPLHRGTLDRLCAHVDQLQQRLRRRVLIENPATYVEFAASRMSEPQFIGALLRRTGCGLLLDVSNVFVSAVNHGRDPAAALDDLIDHLPAGAVGELHVAGFAEDLDAAGDRLLIDSHDAPVDAAVWALHRQAVQRLGPVPTLVERDGNLPPLPVLAAEADRARAALRGAAAPDTTGPRRRDAPTPA